MPVYFTKGLSALVLRTLTFHCVIPTTRRARRRTCFSAVAEARRVTLDFATRDGLRRNSFARTNPVRFAISTAASAASNPFVPHLQSRAINGLLQGIASQHAKRMRHSSLLRRLPNPARHFVDDHVVMRRIPAQQTAETNDRVILPGLSQSPRRQPESQTPPAPAPPRCPSSPPRFAAIRRKRSATAAP